LNSLNAWADYQCQKQQLVASLENKMAVFGGTSLSSLVALIEAFEDVTKREYEALGVRLANERKTLGENCTQLLTELEFTRLKPEEFEPEGRDRPTPITASPSVLLNNMEVLAENQPRLKHYISIVVSEDGRGSSGLELKVRPTHTLSMLKGFVDARMGVTPEDQKLLLFGTLLEGNKALSAYGILDGSVVTLLGRRNLTVTAKKQEV
jgi:hypothetical protein